MRPTRGEYYELLRRFVDDFLEQSRDNVHLNGPESSWELGKIDTSDSK